MAKSDIEIAREATMQPITEVPEMGAFRRGEIVVADLPGDEPSAPREAKDAPARRDQRKRVEQRAAPDEELRCDPEPPVERAKTRHVHALEYRTPKR